MLTLFGKIDVDGSKVIEKEEAKNFWNKNNPDENSEGMFKSVDKNNDGSVQEQEWIDFWTNIYNRASNLDQVLSDLVIFLNFSWTD